MTPSNPDNNQPFIYRICDALGINHQVVPVNHQHNYLVGDTISLIIAGTEIEIEPSDLPNLLRALADPDNAPTQNSQNLVTSGGVYTALAAKQNTLTFDTTPTAGSTNPVTSGGVKTALDGKADTANVTYHDFIKTDEEEVINLDTEFENNKGVRHYILHNLTGNDCHVGDFFEVTYGSTMDNGEVIPSDSYAIVKVVFTNEGGRLNLYLIAVDGIF